MKIMRQSVASKSRQPALKEYHMYFVLLQSGCSLNNQDDNIVIMVILESHYDDNYNASFKKKKFNE